MQRAMFNVLNDVFNVLMSQCESIIITFALHVVYVQQCTFGAVFKPTVNGYYVPE